MILIETVDRTATKRAIVKSKKGWKYLRVTKIGVEINIPSYHQINLARVK